MYAFYINSNDIMIRVYYLDVNLNGIFSHKIIICPVFMGISKFLG